MTRDKTAEDRMQETEYRIETQEITTKARKKPVISDQKTRNQENMKEGKPYTVNLAPCTLNHPFQ